MQVDRGSSSSDVLASTPAGREASALARSSQRKPVTDSAISILRNVAQILELEFEWARRSRGLPMLHGEQLRELDRMIAAVLELLTRPRPIAQADGGLEGDAEALGQQLAAARRELEEMDRTNTELRNLRLVQEGDE